MKKNVPKWLVGDNLILGNMYVSKKSQEVKDKIYSRIEDLQIDDLDKYVLVQSYFNKKFYKLDLMKQGKEFFTNV